MSCSDQKFSKLINYVRKQQKYCDASVVLVRSESSITTLIPSIVNETNKNGRGTGVLT